MEHNKYRELRSLIQEYLDTDNLETLAIIQNCIETERGCRESIMKDLIEHHNLRFIEVFSADDQVKIVSDLIAQIGQKRYLEYWVSWMLPYVSDKVLYQILSTADDAALVKIMREVKGHIRSIGNCFCNPYTHIWLPITEGSSRMSDRRKWRKIYKKCQRNLKK